MLKLDDQESIDGHTTGDLRSLDLDQPTYVGGIPYEEHSKMVNRTALMHLLGKSEKLFQLLSFESNIYFYVKSNISI